MINNNDWQQEFQINSDAEKRIEVPDGFDVIQEEAIKMEFPVAKYAPPTIDTQYGFIEIPEQEEVIEVSLPVAKYAPPSQDIQYGYVETPQPEVVEVNLPVAKYAPPKFSFWPQEEIKEEKPIRKPQPLPSHKSLLLSRLKNLVLQNEAELNNKNNRQDTFDGPKFGK